MEGEGGQGNGLGTVSEGSQDGELDRTLDTQQSDCWVIPPPPSR